MTQLSRSALGASLWLAAAASLEAQSFHAQSFHSGASPAALTGFGAAVAVGEGEGEVFIAEPLNGYTHGIVYVYRRGGGTAGWREVAQLRSSDADLGDRFGSALAADGGRLLVTATTPDSGRGAAYVFEQDRSGSWRQVARLQPADLLPRDEFGREATLRGDLALVAVVGQGERTGAVYVFRRSAEGRWAQEAKLVAGDAAAGDFFGAALASDGERILVGAPRADDRKGAVYVFRYDVAAGTWSREARIAPRTLQQNDGFGASALLSGPHALVGAPQRDGLMGGVYVFERDAASGEWEERMRLLPFDGARGDLFGAALAMTEREVWVGAPRADGFEGRVYAFRREGGRVVGVEKLVADELERGDTFAAAVAVRGDVAVVGIRGADFGEGTAAIFERDASGAWRQVARVLGEAGGFEPLVGAERGCTDGRVAVFDCSDVDLLSFLPVAAIGGKRGVRVNDVWGWTDPQTGKEYAIVGRLDGAAFVDISDPSHPVYVGEVPKTEGARAATWRDMKVYRDHVYIVSDGAGEHGMQVFDLRRLRGVRTPPVTFAPDAVYDRIHSAHNIVINEATGFAYTVGNSAGGETCGGGLHMINIQEPTRPTFAGCYADPRTGRRKTGYTHDAQCVTYHGPDEEHRGKEICFNASETGLGIADVTDKRNPTPLSVAEYPNVGYSHQGWLTEDHRYFFMDDELDELQGNADRTRTLVWDVTDLDDPVLLKEHFGATAATDHNLYIRGSTMYQSNYVSGLRVLDISDVANPREVGYFDTVPYGENTAGFGGSWSNYPFFESGVIVVTSGREGVFFLRKREARPIP